MKKIWSKKWTCFILLIFFMIVSLFSNSSTIKGYNNIDINNIDLNNVDLNNINANDAISYYENYLSQNYSNDEMANIIEQNSDKLIEKGIDPSVISAGTTILRSCDSEEVLEILKNDLNLDEIKQNLGEDYTAEDLIKNIQAEMTTEKYLTVFLKLLFASYLFKVSITIAIILFAYSIITTWIIYAKAGKHGWASIIPIYRDIVRFKICGFSPWLLLLIFIPILGIVILFIISIVMKFRLAKAFDKGFLVGLGLLFLPVIFESYLAFSKAKYIGLD